MRIRGLVRVVIAVALALAAFAGVLAAPACAKAPVTPVLPTPEPLDTDPDATPEEQAAELLSRLTLEEKVAQLFIITPEALTGYDTVTAAGRVSKEAYSECPVGGLIYFARNIEDPEQVRAMLAGMQVVARDRVGLPLFTCIDEEGGLVVRVADNPAFGLTNVGDASVIGATGDAAQATLAAETIASYLHDLGFNVNFAPVADVVTDLATSPIGDRSFGSDPEVVAAMVSAQVKAYLAAGILPCAKHFPGLGNTVNDTHYASTIIPGSKAQLEACELVPFAAAVSAGVPFVMVGHAGVPEVVGSDLPASFSSIIIDGLLRGDLGYTGLVITDALNMASARELYTDYRIGVEALLAGADLILMPVDYETTFKGIVEAVKSGELTEARIDESVTRIILAKLALA